MLTAIGEVMSRCYQKGWITTRDGNISLRKKDSKIMYITPSGVRKNVIRVEDMVKLKIEEGKVVTPSGKNPSGELHMHSLLQLSDNKTKAILHVHATNIVAAMFSGWDLQKIAEQFPEVNRYTKVGPSVAYLPAVSKELGDATFAALTANTGKIVYDIVGQDRHGVCIVASHPWEAFEHCERLDHICEIVLKSGVRS